MKLTDKKRLFEQVTAEQLRQNLVLLQAKTIEMPRVWVLELCDTIKALQQEIISWQKRYEELDAGHSKLFKDFCGMKEEMTELRAELETTKHIATTQTESAIDYQQEIEKLKQLCKDTKWYVSNAELRIKENERLKAEIEQLTKQIAASDMMIKEYCKNIVDYLVVLAKAREALIFIAEHGAKQSATVANEALEAIEKAVGE